MRLRHKSIRLRMLLLVLVPLLALILVYAYAVAGQLSTAVGLANAGKVSGTTITPMSDALVALNAERSAAVQYLVSRSSQPSAVLQHDEAATDRQFRIVETVTRSGPVTANASRLDKEAAAKFLRDSDPLHLLRAQIASGSIGRTAAINAYSAIMFDGLKVAEQSLQLTLVSPSLATTARQEVNLYAAEMLALEENDIYSGDAAAGKMPASDQKEFAQLAGLRQYLVADAVPQLDAEASGLLHQEVPAALSAALTRQEDTIIAGTAGTATPVPLSLWQRTSETYASHLENVLTKSPQWIQSQVTSSARKSLTTLIVVASLGLLLVIASILFSVLMGRRLMRRLNALRQAALELAHERLPEVMARLRNGETVDVDAEAPPVEAGADEIDQVHHAFGTVHRAAVASAVEETNLRRGVNQVFRNLARRSQALLHRQLGLLDGMERRAEEPDQLEDLFRIDHLTTRMRRHAEGLIVLAGDSSGRGWSQPVAFIDVLRAAVAEVEDYTRIRVEVRTTAALAGPAVADIVHMLAELIENAAVYSPPNTVVRVLGELVGNGFCVEVEDRGLGMTEEQLADINHKLASVPAFDLADSDRLGLFVAGRLAHRHGITVALRSSIYGGTTAVVIIPSKLVLAEDGVPAVASTRYALRDATPVAALSGAEPRDSNGHTLSGNGLNGSGHRSNGHSSNGFTHIPAEVSDHPVSGDAGPGSAASDPPAVDQAVSADSVWSRNPTPASYRAPESVQAGQAIGSTESGPQPTGGPPATGQNDGLPVRVRQASLAPQLREPSGPGGGGFEAAGPASADALRNTMSAMQRGWERGRSAAESPGEATGVDQHGPRHRAHHEEA